jgi:hypothetical protein
MVLPLEYKFWPKPSRLHLIPQTIPSAASTYLNIETILFSICLSNFNSNPSQPHTPPYLLPHTMSQSTTPRPIPSLTIPPPLQLHSFPALPPRCARKRRLMIFSTFLCQTTGKTWPPTMKTHTSAPLRTPMPLRPGSRHGKAFHLNLTHAT